MALPPDPYAHLVDAFRQIREYGINSNPTCRQVWVMRGEMIIQMRKEGYTFKEIGRQFRISGSRVRQIVQQIARPNSDLARALKTTSQSISRAY